MNIKVGGTGPVGGPSKAKGAKQAADGSFSKFLDSTSSTEETQATTSVSRIAAVNFINSVDGDEKSRRRKLVDDGNEILDELTNIRNSLLLGNLSIPQLQNLDARLSKLEANCDDPHLNEIIEEIKIRAAVELAKMGF